MSRKMSVFEARALFTHYGARGATGQIEDVERFTTNQIQSMVNALCTWLAKEIIKKWPVGEPIGILRASPKRLIFSIDLERKEAMIYGQE